MATFDDIWDNKQEEYPGLNPAISSGIGLAKQWAAQNGVPLQVTEAVRPADSMPMGGSPDSLHYSGGAADLAWEGLQWGDKNFNGIADYLESNGYSVIRDPHGTGPHIHFSGGGNSVQPSRNNPATFDAFWGPSVAEASPAPQQQEQVPSVSMGQLRTIEGTDANNQQAIDAAQGWAGGSGVGIGKFIDNATQMAKSYWNTLNAPSPVEGGQYVKDSELGEGYFMPDGSFMPIEDAGKAVVARAQNIVEPVAYPLAMIPSPVQPVAAKIAGAAVASRLAESYAGTDEQGRQQGMVGVGKAVVSPVTGLYDKFIGNPDKFRQDLENAPAETLFNTALELGVIAAVGKGVYEARRAKPVAEPTPDYQPSETGPVTRQYTAEDLTPASRQELIDAIRNQLEQVKQQKWDKAEVTPPEIQTRTVLEPTTYESWWNNNAEGNPAPRADVMKSEVTPPPLPRRNAPAAEIFPQEIKPAEIVIPGKAQPAEILSADGRSAIPKSELSISSEYPVPAEVVLARQRGYGQTEPVTQITRGKFTLDENTGKLYDVTSFTDRLKGLSGIKAEKGSVRAGVSLAVDAHKSIFQRGKEAFESAYTAGVDALDPINNATKGAEKLVGKLAAEENPYILARNANSGATARAEMLVTGKVDTIPTLRKFYNLPHEATMQGVIDSLPKGKITDALKAEGFETYQDGLAGFVAAKRQLELQKINPEYIGPMESAKAARFVAEHTSAFGKSADAFQQFNDNILQIGVDGGLVSKEVASVLRTKYKNYASMARDFSDVSAMDSFFGTNKGYVNVAGVIKSLKDGSERSVVNPLETAIKNAYVVLSRVERNKVAESVAGLADVMEGLPGAIAKRVDTPANATKSIFSVKRNGENQYYQTTPEMYRALTSMDVETAGMLAKVMAYPAGWLRAGATLDPGFFAKNVTRDAFTATLYSKAGFIPGVDTLRGVAALVGKPELVHEFKASGAPMSVITAMDRNSLAKAIQNLDGKSLWSNYNPIELLREVTGFFENATRIREYEKVKNNGGSILDAATAAKDVTLDFSRKGGKMVEPNMMVSFLNAGIQGTDRFIRAIKDNPLQTTTRGVMSITIPSVALWMANHDDVRYQELPAYQRDLFWIIPLGEKLTKERFNALLANGKTKAQILSEAGTMIRIPKPFEPGIIFGSLPERLLDYAYTKDSSGMGKWARTALQQLAPNIVPTAIAPILEGVTNHSFFTGRDIVPQSKDKLPAKMQYQPYNTELSKKIGSALDNPMIPGGVSPAKIDNAISGFFGGLGKTTIDATELAIGLRNGRPDKLLTEQPIIRSFFITPLKGAESVQDFYAQYNRQAELYQEFKATKQKPADFNPALYNRLNATNNEIQALNKASKAIEASKMSDDAKRKQMDAINIGVLNRARKAINK